MSHVSESNEKPGYFVGLNLCSGNIHTSNIHHQRHEDSPHKKCHPDDFKYRNRSVHFMGEVEDKIIKNDNMYEDFKHSKPLKPAEEDNEAEQDTNSEDEGITTRTMFSSATVGTPHVYKPMISPPGMRYKITIINTA